ncbi:MULTISPECIES: hypothetical protein [Pseudomonas syringae group]|uniref:Biotin--protein ligase n=2 Tax=Pseudomonas TaxID=286 RepID=A0A0P9PWK1_PSEA0|nr:hypothetical protein [Pseudomonas amygdali]EGH05273.1 type III effector protein AvrPto1 [Pseudomonas amygdali pv. aesculi str. 0893_23]KPW23038.1 hypothetical protein ALO90_200132 [Pseudomonas amygdali pv. aesculi]KPX18345.1 hypothetical protein ALO71_200102 [Pseudomonas amygdali pv. dendropanacis]
MGNICVGGSSMAHQVNSPDRVSNSAGEDNQTTSLDLRNLRLRLAESTDLPPNEHAFLGRGGSESLRTQYNNLRRQTDRNLDAADIEHRHMTGMSRVSSGTPLSELVNTLESNIAAWGQMRGNLQREMGVSDDSPAPEQFHLVETPSGPSLAVRRPLRE